MCDIIDEASQENGMTFLIIKLMSALVSLECAVDSAISVLERSYGAETPHIKEGIRRLRDGLDHTSKILSTK